MTQIYADPVVPNNAVAEAMAAAQKSRGQKLSSSAVIIRKPEEILAARQRRLEMLQKQAAGDVDEVTLEAYMTLGEMEADLVVRLVTLDEGGKAHDAPTAAINEAKMLTEGELRQVRGEIAHYTKEIPSLVEMSIRRNRFRREVTEVGRALKRLDPASARPDSVVGVIRDCVRLGAIKEDSSGTIAWASVLYGPASNDIVVGEIIVSIASFLTAFTAAGQSRRDARMNEVAKYLVLTVRSSSEARDSELDYLKGMVDTNDSLTGFIAGEGTRVFVPMFLDDRATGQPRFIGEVMMERRNGVIVIEKATRVEAAHFTFGYYKSKVWTEIGVVKLGRLAAPSDVVHVKSNLLRASLEGKLAKEREAQAKKDAALELRDISKIEKPITFADLRAGAVGTVPVNVNIRERDAAFGKWLSCHFTSTDGAHFYVSAMVDGTLEKFPRLEKYTHQDNQSGLEELDRDKFLFKIRAQNAWFERDWTLQREAQAQKAVPLTKETLDGLMGIQGTDGLYTLTAVWYNRQARKSSPVGYIVKREGDTVTVTWSVPLQTSRRVLEEESGVHKISELPARTRAIMRNAWMAINGLKPRGKEELDAALALVPDHLKPVREEMEGQTGEGASEGDSDDE